MWFVLRIRTGKEEQVRAVLEERAAVSGWSDKIKNIYIPIEKVSEIRGGQKQVKERKLYPGYMLVELEEDEDGKVSDELFQFIRSIPGVAGFVGGGEKPTPLPKHEVERMMMEVKGQEEQPRLAVRFKKGDNVRIIDGPFENFDGNVVDVNPEKGMVKVVVNIFGRSTPVELEYWQVESV